MAIPTFRCHYLNNDRGGVTAANSTQNVTTSDRGWQLLDSMTIAPGVGDFLVIFGGIMGNIANERVIVSIFVDGVNQPQAVAQVEAAADWHTQICTMAALSPSENQVSRFDGRCLGELALHVADSDPSCLKNFNKNNKLRNSISDMLGGGA